MKESLFTIGKFAAMADVGVETVRFYQRKGLLAIPPRNAGMRRYGEQDVRRLKFIRKAQEAGFTLREIQELLSLDSSQHHQRARELAQKRIAELDKKIEEMQQARDSLNKLAQTCAYADHLQPCAILAAFDI